MESIQALLLIIATVLSLANLVLLVVLVSWIREQRNERSALHELISQFSEAVKDEENEQHSDHKITVVSSDARSDTRGSVLVLSLVGAALVMAMVTVVTVVIFVKQPQNPEQAWTYSIFALALFGSLGFFTYLATNTMKDEGSF